MSDSGGQRGTGQSTPARIVAGLVAAVAILGVVALVAPAKDLYAQLFQTAGVRQAVNRHWRALAEGDYKTAWELLSANAHSRWYDNNYQRFLASYADGERVQAVSAADFGEMNVSWGHADPQIDSLVWQTRHDGCVDSEGPIHLVKRGGLLGLIGTHWRIDQTDKLHDGVCSAANRASLGRRGR
jgi:hypothetical protein